MGLVEVRTAHLFRENAPRVWVVLDERALRPQVGDATIMRAQVAHLITVSAEPNVTIQVIPSVTRVRTTLGYPVTLLRFRVHDVPDVAYIEQLASASYFCEPDHVSQYAQVFEGLALEALTPEGSVEYLKRVLDES